MCVLLLLLEAFFWTQIWDPGQKWWNAHTNSWIHFTGLFQIAVIPVRRIHDRLQYPVQHSRDLDFNHRRHRQLPCGPCLLYLAELNQSTVYSVFICLWNFVGLLAELIYCYAGIIMKLKKKTSVSPEFDTYDVSHPRRRDQQRTNKRHQDNDHHFGDVRNNDTLREFRIRNSFFRWQRVHGLRYLLLRVCFSVFHELLAGSVHLRILQQRSETAHSTSETNWYNVFMNSYEHSTISAPDPKSEFRKMPLIIIIIQFSLP